MHITYSMSMLNYASVVEGDVELNGVILF